MLQCDVLAKVVQHYSKQAGQGEVELPPQAGKACRPGVHQDQDHIADTEADEEYLERRERRLQYLGADEGRGPQQHRERGKQMSCPHFSIHQAFSRSSGSPLSTFLIVKNATAMKKAVKRKSEG